MLEKIRVIFTIPELRQKILLTLGLLAIYRVGWQVPLPIVDPKAMTAFAEQTGGIGDLLKSFGMDSPETMDGLAKMLPDVVNQLTPNGRVEAEPAGGLEAQLGGLLGKLTG